MNNFIIKLFFALHDNKCLSIRDLFALSFDMRNSTYNIWYLDRSRLPRLYDSFSDLDTASFKWKILMKGC